MVLLFSFWGTRGTNYSYSEASGVHEVYGTSILKIFEEQELPGTLVLKLLRVRCIWFSYSEASREQRANGTCILKLLLDKGYMVNLF